MIIRRSMIARSLTICLVLFAMMIALPQTLPSPLRSVEAGCWETVPLCDIISQYAVSYNGNGGSGAGSYDVSFTLAAGNLSTGSCGSGSANFWFLDDSCEYPDPSTGTGEDTFQHIVRVYPCDSTRSQAFNAHIKLKFYDPSGNPIRSGVGPEPFPIDPGDFPYPGSIQYDCNGNPL